MMGRRPGLIRWVLVGAIALVCWGLLGCVGLAVGDSGSRPRLTKSELSAVTFDMRTAMSNERGVVAVLRNLTGSYRTKREEVAISALRISVAHLNSSVRLLSGHDLGAVNPIPEIVGARKDDLVSKHSLLAAEGTTDDLKTAQLVRLVDQRMTTALNKEAAALTILGRVPTEATGPPGVLEACGIQIDPTEDEVKVGDQGQAGASGSVFFTANAESQSQSYRLNASSRAFVGPFAPPKTGSASIHVVLTTLTGQTQSLVLGFPAHAHERRDCTLHT